MVIVNTFVIVRDRLGMTQQDVALTLAAYGFGSMAAAFILPRILDRIPDRRVMLLSAAILVAGLAALAWISSIVPAGMTYWYILLGGWRSEEHTSELQSLMRISYAVFCLKKNKQNIANMTQSQHTNAPN